MAASPPGDEGCTQTRTLRENGEYLAQAKTYNVPYLLIEDEYEATLERCLEELK